MVHVYHHCDQILQNMFLGVKHSKLECMAEAADHNAVCLAEVHLLRA